VQKQHWWLLEVSFKAAATACFSSEIQAKQSFMIAIYSAMELTPSIARNRLN